MTPATNAQLVCLRACVNFSARSLAMANAGAPPCVDDNKEPLYAFITNAMTDKNIKCD